MKTEELNEIEARASKATPGPWHDAGFGYVVKRGPAAIAEDAEDPCHPDITCVAVMNDWEGHPHALDDAKFVVAAREDVPALVAEVRSLRAEVEVLRGVGCEEYGDGPCGVCLRCMHAKGRRDGIEAMRGPMHDQRAIGAEAEREACAAICDEAARMPDRHLSAVAADLAERIRARGAR